MVCLFDLILKLFRLHCRNKHEKTIQFVQNSYIISVNRNDGWTLINEDGSSANSQLQRTATGLQYIDEGRLIRFLVAPTKYLGNQLDSYGQLFTIEVSRHMADTCIGNGSCIRPRITE